MHFFRVLKELPQWGDEIVCEHCVKGRTLLNRIFGRTFTCAACGVKG